MRTAMTDAHLLSAMQRPEFYPHRPPEVRLVQSHISYVFLAGEYVYKVKKPVRFSFLDFSSLPKRRHYCHEEVRLNRRLAGDTYLGVVAICERDGALFLGGEGDPAAIEFAVHMRRLPDDQMLDRLLERGQATAQMIERVAERMARFHEQADAGAEVTANGDPSAIWCVLEDNYAGVRGFRGRTIAPRDDDRIQAFAARFLERQRALLLSRQLEGRIRDCHGDLHAEHVCFTDGLVIYDCIEFNREFRHCDVASEVAFLAMDLDFHGQPGLAEHLLAAYESRTGDRQLRELVPFYQCYRAYVRGKVDSLKAAEEEVPEPERQVARESAARHFALAYRYTWAYSQSLVAVTGLSGTGKSTIASALHQRTGFPLLRSDLVRKQLAGVPPSRGGRTESATDLYTASQSTATYAELLARARSFLGSGRGVILDATFQRRADRDAVRALARELGVPALFVHCRCDEEEVRRRLAGRIHATDEPSDADWSVYLEQRRTYEPLGTDELAGCLEIDSTGVVAESVYQIEDDLETRVGRERR
jgi:aminoglycoside phosphotransferase family enzyme/predicted kinase